MNYANAYRYGHAFVSRTLCPNAMRKSKSCCPIRENYQNFVRFCRLFLLSIVNFWYQNDSKILPDTSELEKKNNRI